MKSIKDLRESYNLITEKEEHDMNKLTQLVRAGLFDAKKLSALKRAMEKPADKMTAQEKRMLINLLDALMAEVLSDKQVYRKIKQDVMMREAVVVDTKDYLSKIDPRVKRYGYSQKEAPSVLLLKRKAIRVFPDGQKVALYYAQAIDKYVSIPFSEIGISEELELNEISLSGIIGGVVRSLFSGASNSGASDSSANNSSEVAKELKSLEREKTKLKISTDDEMKNRPYTTGVEARRQKYERDANAAMAKSVRENFQNKLEVLREEDYPDWQPKKTSIGNLTFKKLRQAKANQKQWKAGSEAAKKGETLTSRKRLPTERLKDKLVDFYGGTKGAVDRVERITKALSGVTMGTSDIAGSALDTGGHLRKGEYKAAAKEFGLGVALPLATGALGGKIAGKVFKDAERAVASKAPRDFDIIKPRSGVEVPKGLKDVTPSKPSISKGIEKAPAAYEAPKTRPMTSTERQAKHSTDLEIQRETNKRASQALDAAKAFREKYPKAKDTEVPPSAKEPKEFKPQVSTAAREPAKAKVSVKEREPIEFKLAEPATSKGQLVPVSTKVSAKAKVPVSAREPSTVVPKIAEPKVSKPIIPISAREPDNLKYNKSTIGKFPEVKDKAVSDTATKYQTQVQPKPKIQTQTQTQTQKTDTTPTKTKSDEEGTGKFKPKDQKKKRGLVLPKLALALSDPGAKALSPLASGLKLAISGPKREGDSDAIRSRQASIERAALKAQASIKESVNLDGNVFELNNRAAEKVTTLYESLNKKNKKKMIEMMNESAESLEKVISFAVRQ